MSNILLIVNFKDREVKEFLFFDLLLFADSFLSFVILCFHKLILSKPSIFKRKERINNYFFINLYKCYLT